MTSWLGKIGSSRAYIIRHHLRWGRSRFTVFLCRCFCMLRASRDLSSGRITSWYRFRAKMILLHICNLKDQFQGLIWFSQPWKTRQFWYIALRYVKNTSSAWCQFSQDQNKRSCWSYLCKYTYSIKSDPRFYTFPPFDL